MRQALVSTLLLVVPLAGLQPTGTGLAVRPTTEVADVKPEALPGSSNQARKPHIWRIAAYGLVLLTLKQQALSSLHRLLHAMQEKKFELNDLLEQQLLLSYVVGSVAPLVWLSRWLLPQRAKHPYFLDASIKVHYVVNMALGWTTYLAIHAAKDGSSIESWTGLLLLCTPLCSLLVGGLWLRSSLPAEVASQADDKAVQPLPRTAALRGLAALGSLCAVLSLLHFNDTQTIAPFNAGAMVAAAVAVQWVLLCWLWHVSLPLQQVGSTTSALFPLPCAHCVWRAAD